MILASLIALAAFLAATGAYITVTLAKHLPLDVMQQAQRHGRFAHLGNNDSRPGPTRAIRVSGAVASAHDGFHPA
ncbi:MAG: hypothetical protein KGI67_03725 [Pseudomonadota bacterium]|nr:hypothetical protein [Pseudomonadota bacterium]